jgi:hypothetical protein
MNFEKNYKKYGGISRWHTRLPMSASLVALVLTLAL